MEEIAAGALTAAACSTTLAALMYRRLRHLTEKIHHYEKQTYLATAPEDFQAWEQEMG